MPDQSADLVEPAQTAYLAGNVGEALTRLESLAEPWGTAAAVLALCRVRQVLTAHSPDRPVDGRAWGADLQVPFSHPRLEAERQLALGWLAWLTGRWPSAEQHLTTACAAPEALGPPADPGEAAYWRARVQILLHRPEALTLFEQWLRRGGGSAQSTCRYVDLLWRVGQGERAGQIWKTVRANPKVAAVDEAFLLETRDLFRRGEAERAVRVLQEARPRSGILQVERRLQLAWVFAERGATSQADSWLRQAEAGPYPVDLLDTWRRLFDVRRAPLVRVWQSVTSCLVPWLLYQAGQAVGRKQWTEALQWIRCAEKQDGQVLSLGDRAEIVRRALPEIEKLAWAEALARATCLVPGQPCPAPETLAGFADLLEECPGGKDLLGAAFRGDLAGARSALASLAELPDLPLLLTRHLALVFFRAALECETQNLGKAADPHWRRAWLCWLRVLASLVGPAPESRLGSKERHFLTTLLAIHRRFITDLLSRNAVDAARRHWGYVDALLPLARQTAPALTGELTDAVARFREDLAADHLTAARDVMRHGAAPKGWRADYDSGLAYLCRLLSLDSDNLRLLTALVETCGEWFVDCYHHADFDMLASQVSRFTPFARKLAGLIGDRPGDLSARIALAEFWKFRALVAREPAEKWTLYRQAARFDPENENVRHLLAEIEKVGSFRSEPEA